MQKIEEGFRFAEIHTNEYSMSLKDRDAPSPTEKEIIEDAPFMQGHHDFSMFLGERIFNNRSLTYRFEVYERNREYRKVDETVLKNWLMKRGIQPLYDDYDRNYYWMAKCTSVSVTDDHAAGRLIVDLVFDAYPFKRDTLEEGHDIWDEIIFDYDYFQPTEFDVSGSLAINLYNIGSNGVTPKIIADSNFTIVKGSKSFDVSAGSITSESFRLEIGDNEMTLEGNGTIKFEFYKELM